MRRLAGSGGWERVSDTAVAWCGYLLLALATVLAVVDHAGDAAWIATTVAIAGLAAAWIFVLYTRAPAPRIAWRTRNIAFFLGLVAFASVLMARDPVFFVFMISGFFYASVLRPLPLAIAGIALTSVLVNTLIAGLPQSRSAWTFYVVLIVIQTLVLGAGVVVGEKVREQNEERRTTLAKLEVALVENAGLHAQLLAQAREAGILDERARMAREIHDTIAQGLIGIVTQLEAATQARDRAADHARHIENAQRLARETLAEARRSVEASTPSALEAATLPDALRNVARDWSELNAVPVDVKVTGAVIALHPEIEVALLRTAQEALANIARHAGASKVGLTLSFMGDVVALDVRDDGAGFDVDGRAETAGAGFGVAGMRRRIARVAGSLAIESEPGAGTAVSARVPAIGAGSASVAPAGSSAGVVPGGVVP